MAMSRSGPRPSTSQANLWCLICLIYFQKKVFARNFNFWKELKPSTCKIQLRIWWVEYTHTAELVTPKRNLAAGLQIYPVSFPEYMHKWKEAQQKENSQSKDIRFPFWYLIEIFPSSTGVCLGFFVLKRSPWTLFLGPSSRAKTTYNLRWNS